MKKNLLTIVQEILSDMDSEPVNSISDTSEAEQIATVVRTTYYNLFTNRLVPEHKGLLKLTAASDSNYPTNFTLADNVSKIEQVWYQDTAGIYQEVCWLEPLDFLNHIDNVTTEYQAVLDVTGGTTLRIKNDRNPSYYTSFDDKTIVMNSWDAEVDTTLQESKVRAWGTILPSFTISDTFVPDIDAGMFPYLISESKSTAMSLFKGGADQKVEQASRRNRVHIQHELYRTEKSRHWSDYGRRKNG